MLEIALRQTGETLEIWIRGRIDAPAAEELTRALAGAARTTATRFVLRMAEVDFLSSSGIRALLRFHRDVAPRGGSVVVTEPNENVRGCLTLVGLDELLG